MINNVNFQGGDYTLATSDKRYCHPIEIHAHCNLHIKRLQKIKMTNKTVSTSGLSLEIHMYINIFEILLSTFCMTNVTLTKFSWLATGSPNVADGAIVTLKRFILSFHEKSGSRCFGFKLVISWLRILHLYRLHHELKCHC